MWGSRVRQVGQVEGSSQAGAEPCEGTWWPVHGLVRCTGGSTPTPYAPTAVLIIGTTWPTITSISDTPPKGAAGARSEMFQSASIRTALVRRVGPASQALIRPSTLTGPEHSLLPMSPRRWAVTAVTTATPLIRRGGERLPGRRRGAGNRREGGVDGGMERTPLADGEGLDERVDRVERVGGRSRRPAGGLRLVADRAGHRDEQLGPIVRMPTPRSRVQPDRPPRGPRRGRDGGEREHRRRTGEGVHEPVDRGEHGVRVSRTPLIRGGQLVHAYRHVGQQEPRARGEP